MAAASSPTTHRERRPSTGAPVSHLQGPIGPAGISRPKHKRTFTGFGAQEIKIVEGMIVSLDSSKISGSHSGT